MFVFVAPLKIEVGGGDSLHCMLFIMRTLEYIH